MTPYDELPVEVRRDCWGWFGEPWPSFICYDEAGRLIAEMRKPFPAGEGCLYCGEPFDEAAGDSGQAMPFMKAGGTGEVRHVHKECMLREATGSVACLEGHHRHDTGQTRRQEALAAWAWVQEHGAREVLDAPVPRLPAATLRHRVMQPVQGPQLLLGQAVLPRRAVVHGHFTAGDARMT
jgi:hypothetical protein